MESITLERCKLGKGGDFLEVNRRFPYFFDSNKGRPLNLARAVISSDGTAIFQVLLKPNRTLELLDEDDQLDINALENLLTMKWRRIYPGSTRML